MHRLVLTLGAMALIAAHSTAQIQNYSLGSTVSDFTVVTIHGDTFNLYEITAQGKYVIVDFFFADCPPCQATTPMFNEFHEKLGCNVGDVFCISLNNGLDDDNKVQWYEDTYGGDYSPAPIVSNQGGGPAVDDDFNPAAYPTYCLIGPDNTLLNRDIWPISDYTTFSSALTSAGGTATEMECSTTSIDEPTRITGIRAYPNPASETVQLFVSLKEASQIIVEIFNLAGVRVHEVTQYAPALSTTIPVPVSGLANGMYIARLSDGNSGQTASVKINVMQE